MLAPETVQIVGAVLFLALFAGYRARPEEDFLRSPQAFGGAYDAFMARTGRFLPRRRRTRP